MTNMMKAVAIDREGKASSVQLEKPKPTKSDEVLIKVLYSALDPSIQSMMVRDFKSNFIHAKTKGSMILGWHFSGVIEEVGVYGSSTMQDATTDSKDSKSSGFVVGDHVWGHLQYEPKQRQGTFSEYVVVS